MKNVFASKLPNKIAIIVVLVLLFLGTIFHKNHIKEFPSHIHAWAQSDHYALSLGFLNNGFNFFKPETFLMNHQFPDNFTSPSNQSITAVDFPIHNFIPAVLMKLFGSKSPVVYRIYTLLYSLVGLFFLFWLSYLLTKDVFKSFLVLVFAATSPVFVYYQSGFLPSIPSLANVMIGLFFYVNYISQERKQVRSFYYCLLFLTLATLARTTFAIPLLAVLFLEFLSVVRKRTSFKSTMIPGVFSVGVVVSYALYNSYLRNNYGTNFLHYFLPAKNFQHFLELLQITKENWLYQYFSKIHYTVLGVLLFVVGVLFVLKKIKIPSLTKQLTALTGITFAGCFVFIVFMTQQFPAHDYYFLDTFFLPVILLLIVLLSGLPIQLGNKRGFVWTVVFLGISVPMVLNAMKSQSDRRVENSWDRSLATIRNFRDSEDFLTKHQVLKTDKILVLDAYLPNAPLILMGRKGFSILSTRRENIANALSWEYDYIVVQNEFFTSDIYNVYPEILNEIEKIASNGKISLCRKSETSEQVVLTDFLGDDQQRFSMEKAISFDTVVEAGWQNVVTTNEYSNSGMYACVLEPEMEFGLTYKTQDISLLRSQQCKLLIKSLYLSPSLPCPDLVVSISEDGKNVFYKSYPLSEFLKVKGEWQELDLVFDLPKVLSENYEFALYIYNPNKSKLFVDDFKFKLF